ncbi:MAG TPA: M4 family metallopeptidase [Mycobacteriales bacterium]|nr:M4 family metallopeptidase [Mycobacteriales bacterium]
MSYVDEPGALHESLADVFGSLVKQHARRQTASEADWLVGAELLGPDVRGVALRSMTAPGSAYDDPILGHDPQPAHMRDYVQTTATTAVHINSGIPNRAFALAAIRIGGYAGSGRDASGTTRCAIRASPPPPGSAPSLGRPPRRPARVP